MKIAIEGCAHGELDVIYSTLDYMKKEKKIEIDLLICCGDFQSVRNYVDLESMACPPKYRRLNTFYKYYSKEKKAPYLTLFIGGNHEASDYLFELPYGGWVAPNIYYMGHANCLDFKGIRIAGISGIYKSNDYLKGHFEVPPLTGQSLRSVYHIRNVDAFRLEQLIKPVDIFLSHDWPTNVWKYGNLSKLLKIKPYFSQDIKKGCLGSPPVERIINILKPKYAFAAHLHVKFPAIIKHANDCNTKFLALDKCLPNRDFIQVLDIESGSLDSPLSYDSEWLTILRLTDKFSSTSKNNQYLPFGKSDEFKASEEHLQETLDLMNNDLSIPFNFCQTKPSHEKKIPNNGSSFNPQTDSFCSNLNITNLPKLMSKTLQSNIFNEEEDELLHTELFIEPDETFPSVPITNDYSTLSTIDEIGSSFDSSKNPLLNELNLNECDFLSTVSGLKSEEPIKEINDKFQEETNGDNKIKECVVFKRRNSSIYNNDEDSE